MEPENVYGITVIHSPQPEAASESSKLLSTPQPNPSRIVFDLVAIHGLNGHAFHTWTHRKSEVMWLRDLLPELVPNIRIMTYGYNARFLNFAAQQDLRNVTMKLLTELVDLRQSEQEKRRPLIFVCHSLGGIVAKKALTIRVPEEQKSIQDACYGIMFMGTPHKGSSIASLGSLLANIISACTPINPATPLLRSLKPDSRFLFEISEDFVRQATNLKLVSFFEMDMTTIGGFRKKLIVDHRSAILNLPNEITIGQNADHRELARFKSKDDRNFRPVLSRLLKFKVDIETNDQHETINEITVEVSPIEGTSSVLEIPFTATNAFHGRESYFKHIEDYFFGEPHNQDAPRTFAICGLGGSGKTQTAIQYALRYRERYKSAVIFINAASHATLISDFEKVSDLMKLTKGTNKVAGVQAWLSDKKNKDWLLIFDNADDLASICLSNYFPRSKWGHILITSRDQSAVGLVSVEGSSMEPLTAPEAVKVLLQKAHITSHSDKIQSDAETLVNDLGYLPLAIDQAASYVLTRKKTLSDYRRLYHTRQLDLLSYHSKLSNYDKTVLTTWELNFTQVEQDFPAAAILLMIFCFLDAAAITDNMLLRGCTKMNRWSKLGEIEQVSAIDVGIDRFLVDMITDEVAYDDAIEKLLSFSLIRRNNDYNEVRSVSVHPLVQSTATLRVSSADQNKWRTQAILLVCHAFPRDQFIEDTFGDTGRPMMPHVARMLKEFDILCSQMPAPKILRQQVTECLLAASRFLHNSWKEDCTRRVKDLIKDLDDPFVKAWAAQREAAIIRLRGNRSVSQDTLELYLKQLHSRNQQVTKEPLREIKDARLNAMQGQIIVSYAENLLQDNHLAISEQELLSWRPLDHDKPSSLENVALAAVQTNLGRIMREKGDFETSLSYFELLHKETLQDDNYEHTGSRRIVLSNMADLYCELRREGEAINLVQTELDYMEARGHQHISSGRRLQLCLAEAYICLGRRTEARRWLTKVKDALDAMQEPDVLSKYTLFRVWYGLARLAHSSGAFGEARDCWQKAFDAGCLLGWEGKYPLNLVKYSLAHVLHELGDHAEAEELLETAEESIKASGRKFWIVGMATYWFDYVQMQLSQSRATTTTTWTRFGKMAVGSFGSSGVASVAE